MKKSILAIALLTMSAVAFADSKILMSTPELLVSIGGSINKTNKAASVKFTGQETLCYSAENFCINPSLMWLFSEGTNPNTSDFINIGAGVDFKYKFSKGSNNSFYVEAGPVRFIKDFNDDGKVSLHTGVGVEHKRFIFSINAYDVKSPLAMIAVGYRF